MMTTQALERAEKAVGEVAANMHEDVRHVLSPAAIERVARAVLMAVLPTFDETWPDAKKRLPYGSWWEDTTPAEIWTAMIQAILNDGEGE